MNKDELERLIAEGEIDLGDLLDLAQRHEVAQEINDNSTVRWPVIEEFEGLDIQGYTISLQHNSVQDRTRVVVNDGDTSSITPARSLDEGYTIFEDEKTRYSQAVRQRNREKYGGID